MATSYKVLGQQLPTATTYSTLYTVPATTGTVCSTLSVCNQGAATTFRVAVRPAGATLSNIHYVFYDVSLAAADTMLFTLGLTLAATDTITVYAGTSNVSFHLYGSEVS
jgi:hypothetical protein